jgi:hypothetical protein
MQEHIMEDEVKSIWKIKIDSINLTLTADSRSREVKKRYQISNCRFRFGETMLVGIKISIMQNMIVNIEFNNLQKLL